MCMNTYELTKSVRNKHESERRKEDSDSRPSILFFKDTQEWCSVLGGLQRASTKNDD